MQWMVLLHCSSAQKPLNGSSFMSRMEVGDEMNVALAGRVATTSLRNSTNWALVWRLAVLARTCPVARLQVRIERKSAVAKVFESVAFGASGRERQHAQACLGLSQASRTY
jgi:hypothetical protein